MSKRKPLSLLALAVALALLLPAFVWAAYPAEVPRTGQTTCYDTGGNVIGCAGTGQDGDIQAGVAWPNPRFTDLGDGTVLDNLTGLEWKKNANLAGEAKTWQQALDYVKRLNTASHGDWRLPNVNELESLVDAGFYHPALPQSHPFTNVQPEYYWSSTSDASKGFAWFVDMSGGTVYSSNKNNLIGYVWPVRSGQCGSLSNSVICLPKTGQTTCYDTGGNVIGCAGTGQDGDIQAGVAWPSPRFEVNGDTVTDSLTGLEWKKNANLAGAKTWQQALDYVKTLNTGGHSDWRLPNRKELRSLADYARYNPALPSSHPFTNVQLSDTGYWSSTTITGGKTLAWPVGMGFGTVGLWAKTNFDCYVWPVRFTASGGGTPATTTLPSITTTTAEPTTTTSVWCPSQKALGEDNPGLENLRAFRDNTLAQSAVGRRIIEIYYNNADSINAAFDRSPALRTVAKSVLEIIAPMVGR